MRFDVTEIAGEAVAKVQNELSKVAPQHRGKVRAFRLSAAKRQILDEFEEALVEAMYKRISEEQEADVLIS